VKLKRILINEIEAPAVAAASTTFQNMTIYRPSDRKIPGRGALCSYAIRLA
jgi:hypothetical protein